MKVETLGDVIDWNRALHHRLAECLARGSDHADKDLARFLLTYLAEHEASLEKVVAGFEERADPKALKTWVYDFLGREPIDPHEADTTPFAEMSFDEVCQSVFGLHNQVIKLYRYLAGRADTPEVRELVQALLAVEEHETMQLAQQCNRIRDM